MAEPILRAERIGHSYDGTRWQFRGLSLSIAAGEAIAVLGPNGCGKSTLLRALAGLVAPREGVVRRRGPAGDYAEAVFERIDAIRPGGASSRRPSLRPGGRCYPAAQRLPDPGVPLIPLDVALQFVVISAALAFAPGPDNTYVLMQSALGGSRTGVAVTLGLCTGLVVHTAAVALGVAALFQASATAFTALKLVGALYLLYLAYRAFGAASRSAPAAVAAAATVAAAESLQTLYLRGILMNLTNPKVALFFLAFLPQFTRPEAGPVTLQVVQLGLLFILAALVVFCLIAAAAGRLSGWLRRSPRAIPLMNRIAGCIFVGMAVRLATAQR